MFRNGLSSHGRPGSSHRAKPTDDLHLLVGRFEGLASHTNLLDLCAFLYLGTVQEILNHNKNGHQLLRLNNLPSSTTTVRTATLSDLGYAPKHRSRGRERTNGGG